jgi:hypothetical protein
MTDEERDYFRENYTSIILSRPMVEIQKGLKDVFRHTFTESSIQIEKMALCKKIKNRKFVDDVSETAEECIEPIGYAIRKAFASLDSLEERAARRTENQNQNIMLYHVLQEMMKLFISMSGVAPQTIPFDQFQSLVCKKLGFKNIRKGFFLGFIEGTGRKYDQSHNTKWRKTNEVPIEVLDDLEVMDVDVAIRAATKPNNKWTNDMKQKLMSYVRFDGKRMRLIDGCTYKSVANSLEQHFGLHITDGMVKRQVANFAKEKDISIGSFSEKMTEKYNELIVEFAA